MPHLRYRLALISLLNILNIQKLASWPTYHERYFRSSVIRWPFTRTYEQIANILQTTCLNVFLEFPPFPGLWYFEHFLHFCEQIARRIDFKHIWCIHHGTSQAWFTLDHAPFNALPTRWHTLGYCVIIQAGSDQLLIKTYLIPTVTGHLIGLKVSVHFSANYSLDWLECCRSACWLSPQILINFRPHFTQSIPVSLPIHWLSSSSHLQVNRFWHWVRTWQVHSSWPLPEPNNFQSCSVGIQFWFTFILHLFSQWPSILPIRMLAKVKL